MFRMMTRNHMTAENGLSAGGPSRGSIVALAGLLLAGLWSLDVTGAHAQVQIEQVAESENVDDTDEAVRVNFTPGEDAIPGLRSFADEIWPNGRSRVQLTGSGNEAAVYQDGFGNEASVTQSGTAHTSILVQEGSHNNLTVDQRGRNHAALLRQKTSGHTVDLRQRGSNNRYLLDFQSTTASPSIEHNVVQDGSDLDLYQVGSTRVPFNVQQTGNGLDMIIRHDSP